MRTRSAGLVIGVAAILGTLTGAVLLPDRAGPLTATPGGSPSPSTVAQSSAAPSPSAVTDPTPTPSRSATPTPSDTATDDPSDPVPIEDDNMVDAADLAAVGLDLAPRRADTRLELVACDEFQQTLDQVAVSGPPLQRSWLTGKVSVDQQAIAAQDADDAGTVVKTVLAKLEPCQREVATHWVYGPTHTEKIRSGVTVSWLGVVSGELNTTGRAPRGEKINGAIAVLRNTSHVAVLEISWCLGGGESVGCLVAPRGSVDRWTALTRAAALRLA